MKRNIFLLLMCALMVFGVASCGKKNYDDEVMPLDEVGFFDFTQRQDLIDFAQNFHENTPVKLICKHDEDLESVCEDEKVITDVFEAMRGITVEGESDIAACDAGVHYTFVMRDGAELTISFDYVDSACLYTRSENGKTVVYKVNDNGLSQIKFQ